MTPYIIGGLAVGCVYAIATLGLVLTYSSSRIFNFAHGATAFFLAITFHWLAVTHGWNDVVAAALVVLVISPLLGLLLWAVLFRTLADTPAYVRLVSTIGLWVALPPIARILYGRNEIFDSTGIGWEPAHNYKLLGVSINSNQVIVAGAAVLVVIVLTLLLRTTDFGLSTRANVDSSSMAEISGINTAFVSSGSWMIGTALAGLSGVLLAPLRGYQELAFTFLVLGAFAAVVVARMHSLVLGFVGSLLIGLAQSLVTSRQGEDFLRAILPDKDALLNGVPPSIPFILMIIFLLAYRGLGRERFVIDTRRVAEPPAMPVDVATASRWRRLLPLAVVLALILLAPEVLSGRWQAIVAKGLALGIAFLSFTIVTGEGGMISLCQITIAGIAGAVTADLATNHGISVLVAIVLAALIVVPVGMLVALPSLRLGDLYLALITLAFAELVQNTYFKYDSVNNLDSGVAVPRPRLGSISFGNDRAFYYLLVVLFVLVALGVRNLKRSTTGLELTAMRSSEPASATLGVSLVRTKLIAFGTAAFVAGLGGGLYVTYSEVSLPGREFDALLGVVWLAVVVTWGVRSITGALVAGLTFAVLPALFTQYLHGNWLEVPTMLFGLGAIGLAREPRGLVYRIVDGRRRRRMQRITRRNASRETEPVAVAS
jgi:branched-chain amino acid transport system permease protein